MLIHYLGHAGFAVEQGDTVLVIDPWLSPAGAFDGAWFQLPCNHHLAPGVLALIEQSRRRFLYVSHEHQDHFDRAFLSQVVALQPTVLIPRFRTFRFGEQVRALGFKRVVELEDAQALAAGALEARLFIDDGALNRDSAILVGDGRASFLDLNDCKIFDRMHHVRERFGPVDVMTCQFSGAVWHPICYDYPPDEQRRIARQKRQGKMRSVLEAISALGPRRYFPSAGPACFLDPDLMHLNFEEQGVFPLSGDFAGFLAGRTAAAVHEIMPGDVFDTDRDAFVERAPGRLEAAGLRPYIEDYARRMAGTVAALEAARSPEQASALLDRLATELARKLAHFRPASRFVHDLYFGLGELPDRWARVDLNQRLVAIADRLPPDGFDRILFPAWQIERLLDGAIGWAELALTFRARISRSPDLYDTLVNGFIVSEAEELEDLVERVEAFRRSAERITVEAGGAAYEVNRFCPHQGGDLAYGWADGGHWVCPRHRWRFDLADGGRCTSSRDTIRALRRG